MSEYFKNKLQKLHNDFLNNLEKLDYFKNSVTIARNLSKDKSINLLAKEFLKDLEDVSEFLFNEEDSKYKINNVKLYEEMLVFNRVKEEDGVMRYLRLLYIYSVGIDKPSKAKKIIKKNFSLLEKKTISENKNIEIPSNIEELVANLPPNINDLVKNLSNEMIQDIEKNGGNINLSDMMNFANSIKGKIDKKIEDGDISPEDLGKEMEKVDWINKMGCTKDGEIDPMALLNMTSQINDIIKK